MVCRCEMEGLWGSRVPALVVLPEPVAALSWRSPPPSHPHKRLSCPWLLLPGAFCPPGPEQGCGTSWGSSPSFPPGPALLVTRWTTNSSISDSATSPRPSLSPHSTWPGPFILHLSSGASPDLPTSLLPSFSGQETPGLGLNGQVRLFKQNLCISLTHP